MGRETRSTYVHGLPETRWSFSLTVEVSGPVTGRASGTTLGHISIWVCPADGCHVDVCALRPPKANTAQRATIKAFIAITVGPRYNNGTIVQKWTAVYIAVRATTESHYIGTSKTIEQKATFTFDPGVLVRSLHSIILAKTKVRPFVPGLITMATSAIAATGSITPYPPDVRRPGRERMPSFEEPFQVVGPTNESA